MDFGFLWHIFCPKAEFFLYLQATLSVLAHSYMCIYSHSRNSRFFSMDFQPDIYLDPWIIPHSLDSYIGNPWKVGISCAVSHGIAHICFFLLPYIYMRDSGHHCSSAWTPLYSSSVARSTDLYVKPTSCYKWMAKITQILQIFCSQVPTASKKISGLASFRDLPVPTFCILLPCILHVHVLVYMAFNSCAPAKTHFHKIKVHFIANSLATIL